MYTLHAELEGGKFLSAFESLLEGWLASGYQLISLRQLAGDLNSKLLPRHEVLLGQIHGRSGTLALQGPEFLAVS
ncbi:MAG: hypothetical protein A3H35_03535 [Betaproteobacteria bacterium RIFCSPLOWO2_02_FULL_62_17]|nr:MAG: hypothetical protein A3H35_03535 [Betaproteobacteria bacterium RIFCSPLOWO2_02_FULL_62_17]